MNSIRRRAEQMGLKHLPVIASSETRGGAGNQRIYWLATRPAEASDVGSPAGQVHQQIVYTRTENGEVQPALFLRLIFRKGVLENRSWRGEYNPKFRNWIYYPRYCEEVLNRLQQMDEQH